MTNRHYKTTPMTPPSRIGTPYPSAELGDAASSIGLPLDLGIEAGMQTTALGNTDIGAPKIGLIDSHQLTQECLRNAFERLVPGLTVHPFTSVQSFLARESDGFDLLIYFWHVNDASAMAAMNDVSAVCAAAADTPLVVFSDAEEAQHPKTVRMTLKSGARGFIPTRTTGLQMAAAAIRFVRAGGTFAPLNLLLTNRTEAGPGLSDVARKHRLTSRQLAVLSHLQQGKANKIIAHELSMSESTVKVHVRNIMRKMGATNRTQAVYKAQKLWGTEEFAAAM
jgi:DNA-binding NarL/FixJ family response regulator